MIEANTAAPSVLLPRPCSDVPHLLGARGWAGGGTPGSFRVLPGGPATVRSCYRAAIRHTHSL